MPIPSAINTDNPLTPYTTGGIQVGPNGEGSYDKAYQAAFAAHVSAINAVNLAVTGYGTPANDILSGLQYEFDASVGCFKTVNGAACTTSGDPVGSVQDTSGNARHSTLSGTNATFDPVGMNGHPTVNFNGTAKFITPSFLDSSYNTACTIFVVAKSVGLAANKILLSNGSVWLEHNGSTKTVSFVDSGLSANLGVSYIAEGGIHSFAYNGTAVRLSYDRFTNAGSTGGGASGTSSTASGNVANAGGSAVTGNLGLSGALTIGDLSAGGFTWPGQISHVRLYNRTLSLEEQRQVADILAAKWGFHDKPLVLCAGNSLTSGTGSTSGATQTLSSTANNYPGQLWSLLGSSVYSVRIDGYPGRNTPQMILEVPAFGDLYRYPSTGQKQVAVCWEITNDLGSTTNAWASYRRFVSFCQARRALGWKVIAVTVLPRQDSPYAGFETARLQVNTWIKANWQSFADNYADVASDSRLQDPTNTTYFYTDKVHLTSVGYGIVASIIQAAVLAVSA